MLSSLTFSEPFADDSQFVQQALAKYLRHNHLPHILFYELPPLEQSKILARAQELKHGEGSIEDARRSLERVPNRMPLTDELHSALEKENA